jgi:large conductance mechanosensitive channel
MWRGFKKFLFRGNVIDLAVAVVIGAAFNAVVTSLVKDIITPLIAVIVGQPDFSSIAIGPIMIGSFLNTVVSFLLMATAVYFLIVVPTMRLNEVLKHIDPPEAPQPTAAPEPTREEVLLQEIRDLLRQSDRSQVR